MMKMKVVYHLTTKQIAVKGSKKVHGQASGYKSQITIVACASVAGTVLLSMVIFKGERLNHEYTKGKVPGMLYGMCHNGWIDQELFYHALADCVPETYPTTTNCTFITGWPLYPLYSICSTTP